MSIFPGIKRHMKRICELSKRLVVFSAKPSPGGGTGSASTLEVLLRADHWLCWRPQRLVHASLSRGP